MENFKSIKKLEEAVENFKSLKKLDASATPSIAVDQNDPEGTKLNKWSEDTDEVKFDDLVDGDVLENEKVSIIQEEKPVFVQQFRHREFLHLQDGILGVFHQAEALHGRTNEKITNLATSVEKLFQRIDELEETVKVEMGCYIKKGSNAQRRKA